MNLRDDARDRDRDKDREKDRGRVTDRMRERVRIKCLVEVIARDAEVIHKVEQPRVKCFGGVRGRPIRVSTY